MLERRLLESHLARCSLCARVAADIAAISDAIRSAPLEPPPAQIALPPRRHRLHRSIPGAHAAGRLVAVGALGLVAFTVGSWSSDRVVDTLPVRPIVIDETQLESVDDEPAELRVYRRAALLSETPAAPRVGKRPGPQPL